MANRSDFGSSLPRQIKRMLALGASSDKHADGEVRRLWVAAHASHKRAKYRMSKTRSDSGGSSDE